MLSPGLRIISLILAVALLDGCPSHELTAQSGSSHTLLDVLSPQVAQLDLAGLTRLSATQPQSAALAPLAGAPLCGVRVEKLHYATVAADGSAATASGALMLPTGQASVCQGARPIVLYAHGTSTERSEQRKRKITMDTMTSVSVKVLITSRSASSMYLVAS